MSDADWQQQEETEKHRWHVEHQRWYCPFCGNELPDDRAACCGEVGHAETEEDSEKRWAEYAQEFNNGNL